MTPGQAAATAAVYAQSGSVSTEEVREALGLGSVEQKRRDQDLLAYRVLGELMERVPVRIRAAEWSIGSGGIRVQLSDLRLSDHEARGHVMLLAEQFDLDYTEYPLGASTTQNRVSARGDYQGVAVGFWRLVAPCDCGDCGAGR